VAVCSGATRECLFLPAYFADFGVQRSDSAADIHSTMLAASTATNSGTASIVKTKPRPKSLAVGTLPERPRNLRGGVLWSDSRVPFPACLTRRFWSAEIGLCSRQLQHEPGPSNRYKQWHCFNRQNRTSTKIPRRGDTPRKAPQPTWRCVLERLGSAIFCLLILPILECRDRTLQQKATARTSPLPPLQILESLQPSESNLIANPPQRGHSPADPANYAAVCSGATQKCLFLHA